MLLHSHPKKIEVLDDPRPRGFKKKYILTAEKPELRLFAFLRVPNMYTPQSVKKSKSQKINQNHKNIDEVMVKRFELMGTLCSRQWNMSAFFWI